MRPSDLINRMLLYSLTRAVERYSVQIQAFCLMTSHFHIILTDAEVELPHFMRDLDLAIAKSMNVQLRRRENFWGPGSCSGTALEDEGAIFSEIVCVLMNPVAAGLVRSGDAWPGSAAARRTSWEAASSPRRPVPSSRS